MNDDGLTRRFEDQRSRLRGVAYRMLGCLSEADDAVQETWLRLHRAGGQDIENLEGWLTTAVSRICLDMLRARKARRIEAVGETEGAGTPGDAARAGTAGDTTRASAADGFEARKSAKLPSSPASPGNPEDEAILADSVGLALLIVLESLEPAERVAFVLHDLFGIGFEDIAAILGRSLEASRQLASRARRRLRGGVQQPRAALAGQQEVIGAFLVAARNGDFERLLSVLDPEVVFRPDATAKLGGPQTEVRGAKSVAKLFSGRALAARMALLDGRVGILVAPNGRLLLALAPTVENGRIVALEVIAGSEKLRKLWLGVLPDWRSSNAEVQ